MSSGSCIFSGERVKTFEFWHAAKIVLELMTKWVQKIGSQERGKMTMIYGYARVSTATQGRDGNSLEEQVAALTAYGCQEIIQEAFSGKTMKRPQFQALLGKLQASDTLVVTKLDRFARTAIEGVQTVRSLFERGVKVHIRNMGLVENTLTGNLILTVMLAFAEYERGMIVERTQTGKSVARQNPDFRDGRPRKFTDAQISLALDLLASGKSYGQVQKMTGISKSTLVRARKKT